ncbi:MAG: hypothetical protein K2H08_05305, partial [Duncaniella sp.]|nr:hypothetical protein [Duncaniella sp.]
MPRIKISQAAKEFNVTIQSLADQLSKKGITIDASNPNTRLDESAYDILVEAFQPDRKERERIDRIRQEKEKEKSSDAPSSQSARVSDSETGSAVSSGPRVIGKIELDKNNNPVPAAPAKPEPKPEPKAEEKPAAPVVETSKAPEAPKAEAPAAEV